MQVLQLRNLEISENTTLTKMMKSPQSFSPEKAVGAYLNDIQLLLSELMSFHKVLESLFQLSAAQEGKPIKDVALELEFLANGLGIKGFSGHVDVASGHGGFYLVLRLKDNTFTAVFDNKELFDPQKVLIELNILKNVAIESLVFIQQHSHDLIGLIDKALDNKKSEAVVEVQQLIARGADTNQEPFYQNAAYNMVSIIELFGFDYVKEA